MPPALREIHWPNLPDFRACTARGKTFPVLSSALPLSLVIQDYSCVARDDRTHNNYRDAAVEYVFVIRYLGSRAPRPRRAGHIRGVIPHSIWFTVVGTINYRWIHTLCAVAGPNESGSNDVARWFSIVSRVRDLKRTRPRPLLCGSGRKLE